MPISNDTPTSVSLRIEKHTEVIINDCTEHTFYVNGQEYKRLPLDANVREPNVSKSKPYKDMCITLEEEPQNFFENNLGISVVASKVNKISANKYELIFNNGTGILNGGHTQQAILDCKEFPQISKAIIKITVREKSYALTRIAEIAAAQNSSTAVKEYSLAEKKGLFQPIKSALATICPEKEKHIVWYEGREVPNDNGLKPDDLIALLNVFNFSKYHSYYSPAEKSQPTNSSSRKGEVFKSWEANQDTYVSIYPLLSDILDLGDYIRRHFYEGGTHMTRLQVISNTKNKMKKPLIFLNEICEYELPLQFFYPLIAAFRANVWYDSDKNQVGWFKDNYQLFDQSRTNLCEKLRSFYTSSYSNNINKAGKDPNLYEALYIELDKYIAKDGEPEKTYDIQKQS